ncbi:MAG: NCS2 family permease [bacterium]|nr:NCS2 family permease [bacterium]
MKDFLVRFFKLDERGTGIRTEVIAGATTFLTMMYIVPLNGFIMKDTGMPVPEVITATALITIIATIANGLWSNTPIAMSVGLGLNSFFAAVLVKGQNLPWQTVLGIVFLSGMLFFLLTITNIRRLIIDSITPEFKIAISAGIGLFIAFVGLKQMGIVVDDKFTLVTIGKLSNPKVLLGIIGLFITICLVVWKVKGAFIIGIITTSIIGYIITDAAPPSGISGFFSAPVSPSTIFLELDILSALKWSLLPPIITFMLTDLFDSLGTLAGVGHRAGIFEDSSKPIQRTLEVDATATVLGSLLGLSTTTSFIESAAGVEEGGRTGLTSVVTGLFFVGTLFLVPFFTSIPPNAIYPVLVIVGVFMFADLKNIDFSDMEIGIPCFLIIILMPLTFSITKGLAAGFITYVFIKLVRGKVKELNPVIIILAAISILAFVLE